MSVMVEIFIFIIRELNERDTLDLAISRAMGVKLLDRRINIFDENDYVLTLDFALKMLNIHERRKCKVPVIIEGETGVGKTALIEMLSKLWNIGQVRNYKQNVLASIKKGIVSITLPYEYSFSSLVEKCSFSIPFTMITIIT